MKEKNNRNSQGDVEIMLHSIDNRIEALKAQYNLFFSGDLRVPPEQERESLEKKVRNIFYSGTKSPRLSLLIQNISSKFALYNNMWLKRLNAIEGGFTINKRKPTPVVEKEIKKKEVKIKPINVSLNEEDSFDQFYEKYKDLSIGQSAKIMEKEKMINSIKMKLITENLIDVKIAFQIEKGKVKLKIKRQNFE